MYRHTSRDLLLYKVWHASSSVEAMVDTKQDGDVVKNGEKVHMTVVYIHCNDFYSSLVIVRSKARSTVWIRLSKARNTPSNVRRSHAQLYTIQQDVQKQGGVQKT